MICLSDIHMGAGDEADDFVCDMALAGFLYYWRSSGQEVWLVGDVGDRIQASRAEIERAHPSACAAIRRCVSGIVRGNHDGDEDQFCGVRIYDLVVLRGTLLMHGQQFDSLNYGPWRILGVAASRIGEVIERAFGRTADDRLESWIARRVLPGRFGDPHAYRRRALKFMKAVGAERIVIGHTHRREVRPPYYNCGSWIGSDAAARAEFIKI